MAQYDPFRGGVLCVRIQQVKPAAIEFIPFGDGKIHH